MGRVKGKMEKLDYEFRSSWTDGGVCLWPFWRVGWEQHVLLSFLFFSFVCMPVCAFFCVFTYMCMWRQEGRSQVSFLVAVYCVIMF